MTQPLAGRDDQPDPSLRFHGVDLRHLAALRAIAEHRSFGRAAATLHVTQSAVSHQLAQLEERLDAILVDRRARGGPDLTPAGRVMLRHAEGVFGHLAAATTELDALAAGAAVVRVGVFPSAGATLLPPLLRRLRAEGVEVRVHEAPDDGLLLRRLRGGELDAAYVVLPVPDRQVAVRELVADPWCVVVPAGGRLAAAGTISLRDLARLPLVGLRTGSPLQLGESRLVLAGHRPEVVVRVDDIGTVQGLVAAGLGVAILPRMLLAVRHPGVALCTLAEPVEPRRVGIAWTADDPAPALRAVIEAAGTSLPDGLAHEEG